MSEVWYNEASQYDHDSPGFSAESRSFTQVVWQSSRKLGIGKASDEHGLTVVVARYEPVGNIDGLFVSNVNRRGHDRGSCEPPVFQAHVQDMSTNSFLSWENEGKTS